MCCRHTVRSTRIWRRAAAAQAEYLSGADELGRDLFSRLLFGARSSLEIELSAVVFALVTGVTWGLVAGYFGGLVDDLSMRVRRHAGVPQHPVGDRDRGDFLGNGLVSIVLAVWV